MSAYTNRGDVRWIVRVCALLVFAAALPALTGCGSGVAGTYVAELEAPEGEDAGEVMKFKLELKRDGVAVMTVGGPDGQSAPPVTGTYTVDGDRITTVLDNDRDVLTRKNGTLTMDFFDMKLVFKKS